MASKQAPSHHHDHHGPFYGTRPPHVLAAMKRVTEDYYQKSKSNAPSGVSVGDLWKGRHVLDIGCYSGGNVYTFSHLVGPQGRAVGTDISKNGLKLASKHLKAHKEKYDLENVEFKYGDSHHLRKDTGFEEGRFDIIHSNYSVHQLDISKVLAEVSALLKVGGEYIFCDAVSSEPEVVRKKEELANKKNAKKGHESIVTPAWTSYHDLAAKVGLSSPRLMYNGPTESFGGCKEYRTCVYRFFKLPTDLLPSATVTYLGTIDTSPNEVIMDVNLTFKVDEAVKVSAEVSTILQTSRYKDHFKFAADGITDDERAIQRALNPFLRDPDHVSARHHYDNHDHGDHSQHDNDQHHGKHGHHGDHDNADWEGCDNCEQQQDGDGEEDCCDHCGGDEDGDADHSKAKKMKKSVSN